MNPAQIIYLEPGEELHSPDDAIKNATVCQWPEGVPVTTKNWTIVYNHFKNHRQFISAEEVTSLIAANK